MTPVSQAVTDQLVALAEAESNSLLQRLNEPLPVLAKCSDHLRGILFSLEHDRAAREHQLRTLLARWHEPVRSPRGPTPDPFFALLSMRFLFLKIAEAQSLLGSRYDNALAILPTLPPSPELTRAIPLLEQHRAQIFAGFARLDRELKAMGLEPVPEL